MISSTFWGFLLRFGEAAIDSSLTLVIGVVVAGVFRRMVGPSGTRKLFGSGAKGLFRGWLAGMLLPVCSLGVIPVARELRRSGVPGGTVLAFVLAAPLLNPISFLYGLTLAEPVVILTFAALSLTLSTLAGLLWNRVFSPAGAPAGDEERARLADAEPLPPAGAKRVLAVVTTAARELAGRDLIFYTIGLLGSALLSSLLPFGSLQHAMLHSDKTSPLLMTGLAVPIYSPPLPGMMKIGLMFDHGNSIGAAFVLFSLGIGTSLGTAVWLCADFGTNRVVRWLAAYVVIVIGFAYLCEPLLYDRRKAEADHTHAFDDYSCPFQSGTSNLPQATATKLVARFGPLERPAGYALCGLLVVGVFVRRRDRTGALERWLIASHPAERPRAKWDVTIPGPVLGGLALVALVGLSVAGAYVYYPDREQCFNEMVAVNADAWVAVRTGKKDEAIRHLEHWDLVTRKLQVGVYIRDFAVTADQAKAVDDLREELEEVRDALIAGNTEGAKAALPKLEEAYRKCKEAYPVKPKP
ncbi:MAG: hypothetical protein FJ304_10510 [Planctomycetes bacterium]|nr:hypothetical protein [Planctomycetota bacterium]